MNSASRVINANMSSDKVPTINSSKDPQISTCMKTVQWDPSCSKRTDGHDKAIFVSLSPQFCVRASIYL